MSRKSSFTPDSDKALEKLVRETVKAAGAQDPADIPHRVRARVKDQATGAVGVHEYVKRQKADQKKRK